MDLDAVGVSNDSEGGKSTIDSNEPPTLILRPMPMVAILCLDGQAHIPSISSPRDRCGQNSGTRSDHSLTGAGVDVPSRAEHSPQPPGVVVHTNGPDPGQRDRPGMDHPNSDSASPACILVAETETVAAASLALSSREAGLPAARLGISSEPSTKIDGGFLEYLCRHLPSPRKAGYLFGCGSIWSNHEHSASVFACLPAVERVDQVEA